MDISIIIPCYNALGKLERCLTSLRNQTISRERYEVIFVDDCSNDATFVYLQQQAAKEANWRVLQLPQNSGSPSRPRNVGTANAKGEYIFYLDCDDEILPDTLELHYAYAKASNACIVRGYLIADDGKQQRVNNRLAEWRSDLTRNQRIEQIIGFQSTIPCSLIKRELLKQGILWPEELRMGEDSVFLTFVLVSADVIEYFDHPTYIYNQRSSFNASSTQAYGSRELNNHLTVWQILIDSLSEIGIDYVKLRLRIGLQTAIRGLIFHRKGEITKDDFIRFTAFLKKYERGISRNKFSENIQTVLNSLKADDYSQFKEACKPKLLIAGYDLKFILPVLTQLKEIYQIEIDEWQGHDAHDERRSEQLLKWADYVWCEWMLGNAVWYAEHKFPHQKLVIRMHRFELGRDFGDKLKVENVDVIFAVSLLFFERLLERFPNIPRQKVRLLHNYVDTSGYQQVSGPECRFNLAMIGILPSRKGFHLGIELLNQLKQRDRRYRLKIFGKGPQDLPWLHKHQDEMAYYVQCEEKIREYGLTDSVEFLGHCDIKTALADQRIGYVLSLSDDTAGFPGPESFHLAVTDGLSSNANSLILYWSGSEYIYPSGMIFKDLDQMLHFISGGGDIKNRIGSSFSLERYSLSDFINQVVEYFK